MTTIHSLPLSHGLGVTASSAAQAQSSRRCPLRLALSLVTLATLGCGSTTPLPSEGQADMANPMMMNTDMASGFSWLGTWLATVSYTSFCTFGGVGSGNRTNQSHSNALVIQNDGSGGLTASLMPDYSLTGVALSTGIRLAGKYPVRDFQGTTAGTFVANQNNVTLTINTLTNSNQVSGTISGSFKTTYTCQLENGTIQMQR
ncbi:MAG: hypothetical protein JNJ46_08165 [Myxococcales bacterium]|nr:hypothetical protein [Myxococcales bacterium]